MLPAITTSALNRLLAIHCRSFPQYLMYARPYAPGANGDKLQVVEHIVDDQQQLSERIAALLKGAEETPNTGRFPMEFTDTHDLCIDYLLSEAAQYQRDDIETIEACVAALKRFPEGFALAEEALGMAKGHLHTLEEVAAPTAGPTASPS
jgi:hypothetical protein